MGTAKFSNSVTIIFFVSLIILFVSPLMTAKTKRGHNRKPCDELAFYFHDILYNGKNANNATSVLVGAPALGDKIKLDGQNSFGDVAIFDDPITLDNNLHSPPIGRAQGFYFYDKKDIFTAWLGFSFVFNSTERRGSIYFAGANPIMSKTTDISVIGGTGNFAMARGVASLMTHAFELPVYFRLLVKIKLYECWGRTSNGGIY